MPDTGKNAIQSWNGDNSTTSFVITFPFLDKSDIEVKLAGVVQTRPTLWDFSPTDRTIIIFVTAPPTGTNNVVITRKTSHPTPKVTFTNDAPPLAAELDKVARQSMYYTEEVEDKI